MSRLNLKRKLVCSVVRDSPERMGMIKKIDNFVAYGTIDKETFIELIKKRAETLDKKKIDAEKIASEYFDGKTEKNLKELGIKNFFRLHPPRGGMKIKFRYPRGVLGNHKDKINELIRRML